jgi:hypothetical protein
MYLSTILFWLGMSFWIVSILDIIEVLELVDIYYWSIIKNIINIQYIWLKEQITPYCVTLGYNTLYNVSVCQIQYNKLKNVFIQYFNIVKEYLENKNIIDRVKLTNQVIHIIDKYGNIPIKASFSDKINWIEVATQNFEPKFHVGLFLYDKNGLECTNIVYNETIPDTKEYQLSKISFMMVELEYENITHLIDLKNTEWNYYIVNNSLNKNFFKYYLNNCLNVTINEDNFYYKVTILDNNVNFITLLPEQYIIFNENDYTIYPNESICDERTSITSEQSDDFVNLSHNDGEVSLVR